MTFDGAVIREQGVTFAVVAVKSHVVQNSATANEALGSFSCFFPGLPVVLMGQDGFGRPTYYGRRDIARFMSSVPVRAIPWRRYSA